MLVFRAALKVWVMSGREGAVIVAEVQSGTMVRTNCFLHAQVAGTADS